MSQVLGSTRSPHSEPVGRSFCRRLCGGRGHSRKHPAVVSRREIDGVGRPRGGSSSGAGAALPSVTAKHRRAWATSRSQTPASKSASRPPTSAPTRAKTPGRGRPCRRGSPTPYVSRHTCCAPGTCMIASPLTQERTAQREIDDGHYLTSRIPRSSTSSILRRSSRRCARRSALRWSW